MTESDATDVKKLFTAEYFTIYDTLCVVQDIVDQEGDPSKLLRIVKSMLAVYHQHVQAALKQ